MINQDRGPTPALELRLRHIQNDTIGALLRPVEHMTPEYAIYMFHINR